MKQRNKLNKKKGIITMQKLTQAEVNRKYKNRYVEIYKTYDYRSKQWLYEIGRTSKTIRENMTLGQDVGTNMEYCR